MFDRDAAPPVLGRVGATLVALGALWGCEPDPSVALADEGCEIIRNPVTVLGDHGEERSVRQPPRAVLPVEDGFLVFEGTPVLLHYDGQGRYVGEWADAGQGPGELSIPMSVATDPLDTVWVAEMGGRISLFGPDGGFGRLMTEGWPAYPQLQTFTAAGDPILWRLPREGARLEVLTRSGSPMLTFDFPEPDTAGLSSISLLEPGGVVPEGQESGGPERVYTRTLRGDALLDMRLEEDGSAAADTLATVADMVTAFTDAGTDLHPDSVSGISQIARGPDGTIWGTAFHRIADHHDVNPIPEDMTEAPAATLAMRNEIWDVLLWAFDDESRSFTVTPPLEESVVGFVDGSRHYTLHEDSLGLLMIQIWEHEHQCG
jgi:hypothetical protein